LSKYLLRCVTCSREYDPVEVEYTCPACGDRKGTLEVIYDFDIVRREYSRDRLDVGKDGIWAFDFLLPFEGDHFRPNLLVGNTPLYRCESLSRKYAVGEVFIKDDGRNPTASFKDRASSVAAAKAVEKGYGTVFCASTGNAASSLSGMATVSKLKSVIFVPATAPQAKLTQLQVYGSKVLAIEDSYDRAFDLSMEIGLSRGWYCRNSAINPYLLEGKKTCALELAFSMIDGLPDYIFVSAGDGTVLSSFHKGFDDLREMGAIDRLPVMVGVQASGAAAIKKTYEGGLPFEPVDIQASSVADSICVGKPRDVVKACRYTHKNKGMLIDVSDKEILEGIIEMARESGVFAEPAGATALAGFKKCAQQGLMARDSRVVIVVTGNGLKDLKSPSSIMPALRKLPPDREIIEEAIGEDRFQA
jgi:threonine synthase